MKRISILVIIALVAMALEMVAGFVDAWGGSSSVSLVKENLKQSGLKEESKGISQVLNVSPLNEESITGTVLNKETGRETPYAINQITTVVKAPWWMIVSGFLFLPLVPLVIWGITNFVKMLISVFRHQIFTRKNARRLRIFVYTSYGSVAVFTLFDWFNYRFVAAQVELPGYVVEKYEFVMPWSDMLLVFLIAEIFALGVKLQEEQELTI